MNCNSSACLWHLGIWEIAARSRPLPKQMRNIEISPFYRQAPLLSEPTRNSVKFQWGNKEQLAQTVQSHIWGTYWVRDEIWSYLANREARAGRGGLHPNKLVSWINLLNMKIGGRMPTFTKTDDKQRKSSRFIARHHFLANRPQINQFPIGKQMTNHTKCTISHFGSIFGSCHNLVRSGGPKGASKLKSVIKLC